ncbi:SSH1 phosphatase, partial [Crypturellus undulatus]|nr:SSH1 phosphatase [Crypturellus undulatus]
QPPLPSQPPCALAQPLPGQAPAGDGSRARNHETPLSLAAGTGALEAAACKLVLDPHYGILEKGKDAPKTPVKTVPAKSDSHGDKSPLAAEVGRDEALGRKDSKPAKDLKYLLFSKELEKPSASSYLMQHQESLIQLQKAGLVRKHTKELERLKRIAPAASAASRTDSGIADESQELGSHPALVPLLGPVPLIPEDAESEEERAEGRRAGEGPAPRTSTPGACRPEHMSSFTKDFLKTICYTPSSSRSSNLTRSSSSDSIHSVRGKPGLVKQRTQEIETRLRLAGLTVSSPLKRSNSLAKLGCLDLSSEDLSSDVDVSTITDSKEAVSSESSVRCEPQGALRSADVSCALAAKAAAGTLKHVLWMGKS